MAMALSLDKVHQAAMASLMIVVEAAITEEIHTEDSVKTPTEGTEGIMKDVDTRSSFSTCGWRMFGKIAYVIYSRATSPSCTLL